MMKISIEGLAPFARDMAIAAVEAIQQPKFTYRKDDKTLLTTVNFDVDAPDEDMDKCIDMIKLAIKGSEKGKMLVFRVVPTGALVYFKK